MIFVNLGYDTHSFYRLQHIAHLNHAHGVSILIHNKEHLPHPVYPHMFEKTVKEKPYKIIPCHIKLAKAVKRLEFL